ncbi:putative 1-acyl-sn-glycerol-3-phosphate acyltransferase 5, partial [Smittium mucronatum]
MSSLIEKVRFVLLISWFIVCVTPYVLILNILHFIISPFGPEYLDILSELFGNLFGFFIVGTMDIFCPYEIIVSGKKSDFPNRLSDDSIDWALGYIKKYDYYLKFVAKESIRKIPVFGRALELLDFLFLKRSWKEDQENLQHMLDRYSATPSPKFVTIFPEGTTINPKFTKISNEYAEAENLKPTKHVLLPKSSGAYFILQSLRNESLPLYSFTIGYSGLDEDSCPEYSYPIVGMFTKKVYPKRVHIFIERFNTEKDVPSSKDGFNEWLLNEFYKKDEMLSHFYKYEEFPPISKLSQFSKISGSKDDVSTNSTVKQISSDNVSECNDSDEDVNSESRNLNRHRSHHNADSVEVL